MQKFCERCWGFPCLPHTSPHLFSPLPHPNTLPHTFPHPNILSHTSPNTLFHNFPHTLTHFPTHPTPPPTLFTFSHICNTLSHTSPIFSHPSTFPHLFLGYFPCTPIHFPTPTPHFSTHSTSPHFSTHLTYPHTPTHFPTPPPHSPPTLFHPFLHSPHIFSY